MQPDPRGLDATELRVTVLVATARALAKLIESSPLYAANPDVRLGVGEVLRLTEPGRWR